MTAIAAFTGAAASQQGHVARMLDAVPHRGSHVDVWTADAVQLGIRGPRPVRIATLDGNAVAFTGRIDNAPELARELDVRGPVTDAALLLHAFARWGDAAAARVLGDFAFALWDAAQSRLVCARDVIGHRPLFHAVVAQGAMVASESRQLRAHPGLDARVNEGVVAEFLTGNPVTVEETIWAGVSRARNGELIVCDARGVRRRRYWEIDAARTLACRTDAEYDEQFRALFDEAIACRTRGEPSVGLFLSGGLDSSAIAGVAAESQARGGPPVRTYSLTFPGIPTDERAYIDAVVERWRLPSVTLVSRAPGLAETVSEINRYEDLPAYPNGAVLDPLRARAAQDVRVVLTGYGGDDWFTGNPLHTTDLLRQGALLAALRQLRADASLPGRGYTFTKLLRSAVAPLLSPGVRRLLRPIAGTRLVFPWIRPEFAARVNLLERLRQRPPPCQGTSVQRAMHMLLNSLSLTYGYEVEERAAAAAGLDQRCPFNDRRIVEFGVALPEAQRWAGDETKVVMRRALASVLPALVRARRDKAEFTPTLVQTIEALGGAEFFQRLRVQEAGWVDGAALRRAYPEMLALYRRGDEAYIPLADALWSVAAVELWFTRAAEENR
jgi:asparagine synthase (glutamine-hydrolysing)